MYLQTRLLIVPCLFDGRGRGRVGGRGRGRGQGRVEVEVDGRGRGQGRSLQKGQTVTPSHGHRNFEP